MNTRPDEPLDSFESSLLTELRGVVTERSAEREREPEPARRSSRRPLALAGAAAAAVAAIALWNVAAQPTPAYALDTAQDGSVTLTIHRLDDAAALQADLIAHGITADVTYLPNGQTCADGRYVESQRPSAGELVWRVSSDGTSLTIPSDLVAPGETLVLVNSTFADGTIFGELGVAEGPIGECTPIPAPALDEG